MTDQPHYVVIDDLFHRAAHGDLKAQEEMIERTMSGKFASPEIGLAIAETFARLAHARGSTTALHQLARITDHQAVCRWDAGDRISAAERAATAVAIYNHLAENGDDGASAKLEDMMRGLSALGLHDEVLPLAKGLLGEEAK